MATGCPKCDGTGLIPLQRKDGSVVQYAWLHCQCYEEQADQFHRLQPEDIDFPVSYSFYRGLCQQHGWPDPGSDIPLELDSSEGDCLKAEVLELKEKVSELTARRQVAKQGTKFTIR